jgi:hypothetical protein
MTARITYTTSALCGQVGLPSRNAVHLRFETVLAADETGT